jgi:hypothetical protein
VIILISIGPAIFRSVLAITNVMGQHGNVTGKRGMRMGVSKRRPARATYETAIDNAIAACHGDVRGTLKVLLMANEYLEIALADAHSALQFARAGDVARAASRPKRPTRR